ncbi:MAG: hypothetical protein AB1505_02025 [Candidatus Latescibacterota bacterium]
MAQTALSPGDSTAAPSPAQWPMQRHDKHLTARSEGVGRLRAPGLSWRYDLRAWEVTVAVTQAATAPVSRPAPVATGTEATIGPFVEPRPLSPEEQEAWGLGAQRLDLAGDGRLVPAPSHAARILADVPGYQRPETVMADAVRGRCVLHAYDTGQPREVWRSPLFGVYQGPHPVVVDANGDGQLDVVACPHYQVVVMDGRTGAVTQQLRWHNGRNYGHFIAKDIDGDGLPEFLVLADFYTHMALLDNDGRELNLLWRKEVELKIESKQKILRPRWDALQDLDGDGRFEVVTNLYNDTGDRKWHLMVYDALTGNTVLDLPDTYLEGLEDLDGDGRVELFCSTTDALYVPTSSPLRVLNLDGGWVVERWAHPRGAWALGARPYPLYMNSNVAHGEKNLCVTDLGAQGRGFFLIEPAAGPGAEGPRLCAFRMSPAGQVESLWTLTGPPDAKSFEVLGARRGEADGPETLVRFRTAAAEPAALGLDGGTARPLAWERILPERPAGGAGDPIAADLDGEGHVTVVSLAANRDVVALTPPKAPPASGSAPPDAGASAAPRAPAGSGIAAPMLRWRRPGTGPLCAADFDGDGHPEVAFLSWDVSGQGTAEVVAATGRTRWRAIVHGFPGPLEPWNFGTLTGLAAGRFTGGEHDDLIVFSRRSTMHSDEGHAFRGPDGAGLWSRAESFDGTTTWGFGGAPVAVHDVDGDGAEDIVSLYPVNLTVVSGRDGAQLAGRSAASDDIFPGIWAAYAIPFLFDFEGTGAPALVWNGGYCLGITDLAGNTRWASTPAATGYPTRVGGAWHLASTCEATLRWMGPADGTIRWSLPLPAAAGPAAVADVDGDGTEEVIVACGDRLVAAHVKDGSPALLWNLRAPAPILGLILADTDGDGLLEVVLSCGDGFLYGVNEEGGGGALE